SRPGPAPPARAKNTARRRRRTRNTRSSRRQGVLEPGSEPSCVQHDISAAMAPRYAFYLLFIASGFAGLIYESIWTHYLKLYLGHAAYAQSLVLIVFMGGMALGSALCARLSTRVRNPLAAYAAIEAAIGLCALVFHEIFVAATDWSYAMLLPALG